MFFFVIITLLYIFLAHLVYGSIQLWQVVQLPVTCSPVSTSRVLDSFRLKFGSKFPI